MAKCYIAFNGPMPTTGAPTSQPTGASIRTMLQLATPAANTGSMRVVEWGCSFDGTSIAVPGKVELIETDVAATMTTALTAPDLMKYNGPNDGVSQVLVGATNKSGFATTTVTEGSITTTRLADGQQISPTGLYVKQFPLGREFECSNAKFLRIRMTFAVSVDAYCYIVWEE